MVSFPKLSASKLRFPKLSFSSHVYYDQYDPNKSEGKDVRKSLAGLDYSPLRRITWASFSMGVLISMGGFV
jgi:MFS transporter, SP family, sugar:H+ symporter